MYTTVCAFASLNIFLEQKYIHCQNYFIFDVKKFVGGINILSVHISRFFRPTFPDIL